MYCHYIGLALDTCNYKPQVIEHRLPLFYNHKKGYDQRTLTFGNEDEEKNADQLDLNLNEIANSECYAFAAMIIHLINNSLISQEGNSLQSKPNPKSVLGF